MLHGSSDYIDSHLTKCQDCGKETEYFIDHIPEIDAVCPECAQKIMRRLFEDLIEYHNRNNKSKHPTLTGIFYHGDKRKSTKEMQSLFDL